MQCLDRSVRLLFGLRVPDDVHFVEVRPVVTGSCRPRLIFRGPLEARGVMLTDNDIADALARDLKFWRWIRSEERARRLRTEYSGKIIRFKLSLSFRDRESALIIVDPASGIASLITRNYETFDNETLIGTYGRF